MDIIALCAADSQANGDAFSRPFLHGEIHDIAMTINDENLKHTIQFGIGMHHAGLSENDRQIVEELFVTKKIQVLDNFHSCLGCELPSETCNHQGN